MARSAFSCPPTATRCKRTRTARAIISSSAAPVCLSGSWKRSFPSRRMSACSSTKATSRRRRAGELKIVMRTANYDKDELTTDPPRAYSSVSKDGGRTWSVAREEPDLHNAKSKGFFVAPRTACISTFTTTAPPSGTRRLSFRTADECHCVTRPSRPAERGVRRGPFFDAGIKNSYPTLLEVAPGDFRAVWDSGTADTRAHVHQLRQTQLKP